MIALLGAPNAGKSTLLNVLVGQKLAIVTHKIQTTRTRLRGIVIEGAAQLIFVDTPGIFRPRHRLDRAMVDAAWAGAADSDCAVLLVDAEQGITGDVSRILKGLRKSQNRIYLALNKIDLVKREKLLALADDLCQAQDFEAVFMISALKNDGVQDLAGALAMALPYGPWLYSEDDITDTPERVIAAEITREQIYLRLHQELPYAIYVETESWEERKDGSVRIQQVIHVERKTQKGMVIGKKGSMLKEIGARARLEMESILERRVHLFLFVKISEKWRNSAFHLAAQGLEGG